jgi:hypothetical protein
VAALPGRADARVVRVCACLAGSIGAMGSSGLWVLGSGAPGSGSRFRFGVVVGGVGFCSGFGSTCRGITRLRCGPASYGLILDGSSSGAGSGVKLSAQKLLAWSTPSFGPIFFFFGGRRRAFE